ncbi:hypothetical protein L0657_21195 [Dyadobacter sp. CY345]|uniref:DUF922 domain-containing protein n=1 Tax=Dyadobacter sp. CY345 TaxID=2909335 RepID=UPI001F21827D|nr:hypothetical protein [Dyadobacter sp. CY345]MCF2446488.1 hypothetical protein [Dyadobacter sp. CY345]
MNWIQYRLTNKSRTNGLICLFIFLNLVSFAQITPEIITLTREPSSIIRSNKFFVQDVDDKRKTRGNVFGKVISFGKEKPAALATPVEKELASYWSYAAPRRNAELLPLQITIKDFQINEKRLGPNRVSGDIKLEVTFRWYRNMVPVELTNYQTSATYTRPEKEYDHEKLIRQMLDQALIHFQKWMASNNGKNPALSKNLKIVFNEVTAQDKADTVFYSVKRPLVWSDFQGQKSRPGSRYAAAVFTSFAYEGHSYPKDDDLILQIDLKIFMVKSMSWGLPEAKNAGTLRHEQLHFDITRVVVERFKKRLESGELTIEDYDSEIQYQFLEAFREMNREQEAYDAATAHGLNATAQAEWERKISKEILDIYSRQ